MTWFEHLALWQLVLVSILAGVLILAAVAVAVELAVRITFWLDDLS